MVDSRVHPATGGVHPATDPQPGLREYRWPGRVAWSDTDTAGVVAFGAYARWIELAEAELWRDAGIPMGETFDRHELWIPRVDYRCRYRSPLRYEESFEVRLRVSRWTGRTMTYDFAVVRDEDEVAVGELRIAAVDRRTFEGRSFPEAVREALERAGHLEPSPARY